MDKAAQRKAERERRQERIRQSSTNRLAQITGAAGSQDFKKPVVERSLAESKKEAPSIATDNAVSTETNDDFMQFLKQGGESDPLFAMLASQLQGQAGPEGQKTEGQEHFAAAQRKSTARADAEFAWDVVHFVASICLGLYMALSNPWNFTMAFVTTEGVMIATKLVLGHQSSGFPAVAMLAPLMSMLPKNRQRQISVLGALINAARLSYKDMAIALLIYGCASVAGRDFVRPGALL